MSKVFVLNDKTSFTGLGRYAEFLSNSVSGRLISIKNDKQKKTENFPGMVVEPMKRWPVGSGYQLSRRFPNVYYNKVSKMLVKNMKDEDILHYSSPGIVPIFDCNNRVVTIHDVFPTGNNGKIAETLSAKIFMKFASFENVICVSNYTKNKLTDLDFNGKIKVIYPPIAESFQKLNVGKVELRKKLNLPVDRKLVLSVSTDIPRKNLTMVSKVMEELGSDYRLVRIGSKIEDSLTFSNIDDETLNEIYNACDVLLFPSTDEGFGSPLAESLKIGLPAVCSDIEPFIEYAKNIAYISPLDPKVMAENVKEAVCRDEGRLNEGIKIAKKFSNETFSKEMTRYYEDVFGVRLPQQETS